MSDERTATIDEGSLSTHPVTASLGEQLAEIGVRLAHIQADLDDSVHSVNWHKINGQVSNLEVRLTKLERLLELIAQRLEIPIAMTYQPMTVNDAPVFEGVPGESSPGIRRRDDFKHTGSLKLSENV